MKMKLVQVMLYENNENLKKLIYQVELHFFVNTFLGLFARSFDLNL